MENAFQKGNFVRYQSILHENDIFVISGILMNYRYNINRLSDKMEMEVSYEDISPIRITSDMLEKLGFQKKDESFVLGSLSVKIHEQHLWGVHSKGKQVKTCEYIHQLQNLSEKLKKEQKLPRRKIR